MKKALLILVIMAGTIFFGRLILQKQIPADNTDAITSPKKTISLFRRILPQATPTPATVSLIATGDVMLGRSINYQSVSKNDFLWPFAKSADFLKDAQITLINLETPLVEDCLPTNSGMVFCADPRNIAGLTYAGIDIANLANNHSLNYGQTGLESTIKLLNDNRIQVTGFKETIIKEANGIRLAFLGFSQFGQLPDIQTAIQQAKDQADIVIISFHWGEEYTERPTEWQQKYAHLAIDAGADLIIGHHPHWVQPAETYKDKLIIYSLGNFIFDQSWSAKTMQGKIGKFIFSKNGLIDYQLLPVQISPQGQPEIIHD